MILLAIFSRCQSNAGSTASLDSLREASFPQEKMIDEVSVILVEKKTFIQEIETNGTIQAEQAADAIYEASGLLAEVHVENGQRVQRGQLLAVLENREEELQLKKARVALKEKQISYESEMLGADSMRRHYLKYHTGLAAAEVSLEEAELAFAKTLLRAPLTGTISDLQLSIGSRVQPGAAFCHLWNPARLELVGYVLETQLASLQIGQQAIVQPLGSRESYKAILQGINTRVNEHGLVEIRLRLQEGKGLLPGRQAKVYIQIPHKQTIIVPKEAVMMRSGQAVAFIYEEGLAKWKYIKLGKENTSELEVLDGLNQHDSLIITNNLQLAHDARVTIKK